jgi:hypothetical protein
MSRERSVVARWVFASALLGSSCARNLPPASPTVIPAVPAAALASARAAAAQARPLLVHSRRWLAGEVQRIDPASGLLLDTPERPDIWNTRDTAADVYPFFISLDALRWPPNGSIVGPDGGEQGVP